MDAKDLLVGHAQAHVPVGAVLETKHVGPHALPTPTLLPDFSRVQSGQCKFLGAHAIELVPDDPGDLEHHPLGQRQVGIDPGRQLPNVSPAQEQNMARHLGLGRGLSQCRDEGLTPAHSDSSTGMSILLDRRHPEALEHGRRLTSLPWGTPHRPGFGLETFTRQPGKMKGGLEDSIFDGKRFGAVLEFPKTPTRSGKRANSL